MIYRNKPNTRVCLSCHGTEDVVSINVKASLRGFHRMSQTIHLCERCLMYAPDLAKTAVAVQGGPLTLAETFGDDQKRRVIQVISCLAEVASDAYKRLRGGR